MVVNFNDFMFYDVIFYVTSFLCKKEAHKCFKLFNALPSVKIQANFSHSPEEAYFLALASLSLQSNSINCKAILL